MSSRSHVLATLRPGRGAARLFFSALVIAIAGAAMGPVLAQGQTGATQATPAGAGPMGHHGARGMGSPRHHERMLERINATEAQRAQIRQFREAAKPELRALRETGRSLREQSRKLMTAPTIDANSVEQLRLKMVAHHDQASSRRTKLMLDIAQVLTPEQRVQIGALMAQRGGQRGDMKREHRHHHRGDTAPRS